MSCKGVLFPLQRSLDYYIKKPCFHCKEALFSLQRSLVFISLFAPSVCLEILLSCRNLGLMLQSEQTVGGRASRSTTLPKQLIVHNSCKPSDKAERIISRLAQCCRARTLDLLSVANIKLIFGLSFPYSFPFSKCLTVAVRNMEPLTP